MLLNEDQKLIKNSSTVTTISKPRYPVIDAQEGLPFKSQPKSRIRRKPKIREAII